MRPDIRPNRKTLAALIASIVLFADYELFSFANHDDLAVQTKSRAAVFKMVSIYI